MRTLFTIFFLSALTIGAVFVFRMSLTQTLIEVDIEELARYSSTNTIDEKKEPFQFSTSETSSTVTTKEKEDTASQESLPMFEQEIISNTNTEISTPPPLKKQGPTQASGTLSVQGVLLATNNERRVNGQAPLLLNTALSRAAQAKVQDMFDKQYFDHVGPDGSQPSDWVSGVGYQYKLTGENLALGDFSGDNDLVTAWMNSPGHRENILKPGFTEIGIAVFKSTFEGHDTWLAVQIFGRPLPVCEPIDSEKKKIITEQQNMIEAMNANLLSKKETLDNTEQKSGDNYRTLVDEYNALVAQYNILIGETKTLVEEYNASVKAFNACMAG